MKRMLRVLSGVFVALTLSFKVCCEDSLPTFTLKKAYNDGEFPSEFAAFMDSVDTSEGVKIAFPKGGARKTNFNRISRVLGKTTLTNVVVDLSESELKTISSGVFEDCEFLAKIILSDQVSEIKEDAFRDCRNLKNVDMGEHVRTIGEEAFSGCYSLASFEIPQSVTVIGESAFRNCKRLKAITVPDSVKAIEKNAFQGCVSLRSLSIGTGVETIGDSAFSGCERLTSVVYTGTKEECKWLYPMIGSDNDCLVALSTTCSDGVYSD